MVRTEADEEAEEKMSTALNQTERITLNYEILNQKNYICEKYYRHEKISSIHT